MKSVGWEGETLPFGSLNTQAVRRYFSAKKKKPPCLAFKGQFYIAICIHLFIKFTELSGTRSWGANNKHCRQVSCILRAYHPLEEASNNQPQSGTLTHVIKAVIKTAKKRESIKRGGRLESEWKCLLRNWPLKLKDEWEFTQRMDRQFRQATSQAEAKGKSS